MSDKQRVAILGGGLAGLAAAFELTATPARRQRYDVTLYQMGWRLGGKCASSRGPNGRIEEHGLHVLLGGYENAFGVLRRLYDELERPVDAPIRRFEQAFLPHDEVVFVEPIRGTLRPWRIRFPRNDRRPGDGGLWPDPGDYLAMTRRWVREGLGLLVRELRSRSTPAGMLATARLATRLGVRLASGPLAAAIAAERDDVLHAALGEVHAALGDALLDDDALRRLWILLDLGATVSRGILADGLLERGFGAIDDEDFRAWLRRHGGSELAVESALMRALYDLVFHAPATPGDASSGIAAGAALRMSLRFVCGYKGAIGWWMAAGTGETLIAPFYEVLAARGVRFEFFHRVRALEPDPEGRRLARVRLGVQATVREGAYQPLVREAGLPYWPATPDFSQLEQGDVLAAAAVDLESSWSGWEDVDTRTLTLGEDVDEVVLAISVAALPAICGPLAAVSPRWQQMLAGVHSTPTLALQLWSREGRPAGEGKPMMNTGVGPLTGYGDMSHLLRHEGWAEGDRPGHVLHVCSRIDAPAPPGPESVGYHDSERARAHDLSLAWLREGGAAVVPGLARAWQPEAPRWEGLHDPSDGQGAERFESQYWRMNVEPTDRYVLCTPGSGKVRLRADESGFAGLTLAGDWIRTGLDIGSVEAAITSGQLASRAICGEPRHLAGEHDWR
ncbi:MAG: hypothetical protein RIT45_1823 [Pseudomonadota bacterium]|jgi:uncharacterized protein with NAD-binding domain and iron-sulfur cluster